jgi:16S rRNA G966 N2-methylase RsmD
MSKNMKNVITRHPLAEELFGSLDRHEFEGLKEGLREHSQGARVWLYQGHILCGWHTYLACRELGIEPECVEVEAENDDAALLKALSVELNRRSLTEQQRCAIWFRAADRVPLLRESLERIDREAGERQRSGLKRGKEGPARQPQLEANGKAAEKIGKIIGASRAAVERDRRLFKLSPAWHAKVAAGAVAYDTAIRHANHEARIERVKQMPPVKLEDIKLLHCDFRDLEKRVRIEPHSARLVVLDPPYYEEFIKDYEEAVERAARWLDPEHGILTVLLGSRWLPNVLDVLRRHLVYHRSGSIYYGQTQGMERGRVVDRARECHRPVLIFRANKDTTSLHIFNDALECREVEKDWHLMQQPLKAIKHYVEMFTDPHDLVIDTHGGGFTTAVACLLTKRRYVGCDVDGSCVEAGELRLREAAHENGLA